MMLDNKKLGYKIASLRKKTGYSQDKLAEILSISPQAISKWENGHSLPDTSLLPMLAQIFGCTIDEMIMPAYSFEEKLEEGKPNQLEAQAEYIAERVMTSLEGKLSPHDPNGLDDAAVVGAVIKAHGNIGQCSVIREPSFRQEGGMVTPVTVKSPQREYRLVQKACFGDGGALVRHDLLGRYTPAAPQLYLIDFDRQLLLLEDLASTRIQGNAFNDDNENGAVIRANHPALVKAAAALHAAFWENKPAFETLGPEWRLQSKDNLLSHIAALENDYKRYRKNEETGKIPKVWECFENNLDTRRLEHYDKAAAYLRSAFPKLLDTRFVPCKNITVIHGNMHPGVSFMSRSSERDVKFDGLQAVRVGLPAEDLAMLLALHIEPDRDQVMPLLEQYYQCLTRTVRDYPFETLVGDYKIAVAENLFFPLRLMRSGIYDFSMRDRALRAFETFVLGESD